MKLRDARTSIDCRVNYRRRLVARLLFAFRRSCHASPVSFVEKTINTPAPFPRLSNYLVSHRHFSPLYIRLHFVPLVPYPRTLRLVQTASSGLARLSLRSSVSTPALTPIFLHIRHFLSLSLSFFADKQNEDRKKARCVILSMARSKNMNVHSVHPWWLVCGQLAADYSANCNHGNAYPIDASRHDRTGTGSTESRRRRGWHLRCRRIDRRRRTHEKIAWNARRTSAARGKWHACRVIVSVEVSALNIVNYRARLAFVAISRATRANAVCSRWPAIVQT